MLLMILLMLTFLMMMLMKMMNRYNSSRAKCIKCTICGLFFSPNKFIFHSHRTGPAAKYVQPDAANFNSWRRHMRLSGNPPMEVVHAWEDVKVGCCSLLSLVVLRVYSSVWTSLFLSARLRRYFIQFG